MNKEMCEPTRIGSHIDYSFSIIISVGLIQVTCTTSPTLAFIAEYHEPIAFKSLSAENCLAYLVSFWSPCSRRELEKSFPPQMVFYSRFRSTANALWRSCIRCFRVLQACLWSDMWSGKMKARKMLNRPQRFSSLL